MKCLRIVALLVLIVVAPGGLSQDHRASRLVLYIDEDLPRNERVVRDIQAALARLGITPRHRVRMELVAADPSSTESLEPVLRAALERRPSVIVASNSNIAIVAKRLTRDVPIVFASHQDPIAVGLAASLAHPGGNLTGFTFFVPVHEKRLELLRVVTPRASRLGIVIDRWWLAESGGKAAVDAARQKLGFEVNLFAAETEAELAQVFASAKAREMQAWYVPYTRIAYERPDAVAQAFQAIRKPAIYPTTRFVQDGGLISYQQLLSREEIVALIGKTVGLVLDGVPPGEIPVERPKAFELAVNFSTARRLGISLPESLLKRADQVIVEPALASSAR